MRFIAIMSAKKSLPESFYRYKRRIFPNRTQWRLLRMKVMDLTVRVMQCWISYHVANINRAISIMLIKSFCGSTSQIKTNLTENHKALYTNREWQMSNKRRKKSVRSYDNRWSLWYAQIMCVSCSREPTDIIKSSLRCCFIRIIYIPRSKTFFLSVVLSHIDSKSVLFSFLYYFQKIR